MATIKSYTDIQQSKTLAKILPHGSADMVIWGKDLDAVAATNAQKFMSGLKDRKMKYLPCWSLAALLDIMPQEIFDGEYIINITEGLDYRWVLTYDHFDNRNHSYFGLSTGDDNLIDACYKMILKLNELNLL